MSVKIDMSSVLQGIETKLAAERRMISAIIDPGSARPNLRDLDQAVEGFKASVAALEILHGKSDIQGRPIPPPQKPDDFRRGTSTGDVQNQDPPYDPGMNREA